MYSNPFKYIRAVLVNKDTGEMKFTYICRGCGCTMDEPYNWVARLPVRPKANNTDVDTIAFYCEDCENKRRLEMGYYAKQ